MVVMFDRLKNTTAGTEFHWTFTGTNTGLGGTGNPVRISGYELWKIDKDGLISESKGHFDAAEYERQLAAEIRNRRSEVSRFARTDHLKMTRAAGSGR